MANYFFLRILFYITSHLYFIPTKLQGLHRCARLTTVTTKKSCYVKKDKARQYSSCPAWYTYNQAFTQSATGIQFPLFLVFDIFTTVTAFICLLKATDDRILISQKSRSSSRIVRHCVIVSDICTSERESESQTCLAVNLNRLPASFRNVKTSIST